ncbi:MAG: right-handed parallel beta-helix repeat-containing protein [Thermoplasmatales archaeon]|nr:MAG: right-handed parallel beta-helix repeat-containing protein [Thermoplasmatales archaeon]
MSITPAYSSVSISDKSVIIVDDEGDGDYTSIKEALNNSNPGDTIEVYSGTYDEHTIVIETDNIALEGISYELGNGSDTGKPFIYGPGTDQYSLIAIKADGVTINGFRIENNNGGNVCITLYHNASKCIISNNDIAHTSSALIWVFGSDNKILNNNISHSVIRQGIVLRDPCSNCIVSGNVISDAVTGILLWDSNNHIISGNKIMRCSRFGIDVAGSNNKIIGNHLENNSIGIQIYEFFISVKRNNFINNEVHAQFIYGIPLFQRFTNIWFGNYWDKPRLFPYPIRGGLFIFIPTIQFDWFPAKEPYDI